MESSFVFQIINNTVLNNGEKIFNELPDVREKRAEY